MAYQTETNMKVTYHTGQTLQIKGIYTTHTVTVRKVVTRDLLSVSYGFDRNGNDIVGLINVNIHL